MSNTKKIAITIGDPAGIGPEVALKAILSDDIRRLCIPTLIGDKTVIKEAISILKIPINLKDIPLIDLSEIKDANFKKNISTAEGGIASVAYIKKAVELALKKEVDAVVTAPISKESLKLAGYKWPGHTEMLSELTGARNYTMLFYSDKLKLTLVTIHIALKDVPHLIKKERVLNTIMLTKNACYMMEINQPRIAVAGLNPHAGEAGIFGDDEMKEIIPAINEAKVLGLPVYGPYPADSLFYKAYRGEFDIVVCMYHDQGLVPLKMIAFDRAVNVTVGLPIIRTSPDHGTAFDIAWKGIANPSSMIEAIKLATRLKKIEIED